MRQTSNKTLPRFLYLFFAEMGKVCEICVLPGFTFPRTCRRPSFEFSPPLLPSPPRLHARSQRATLWSSSTQESFFPCWHFSSLLPVFIITREPPSHETRQHPALPFRSSPWNALFAMLPGNSLKTLSRANFHQPFFNAERKRERFFLSSSSPFSLSTLCPASFRQFARRILSHEFRW